MLAIGCSCRAGDRLSAVLAIGGLSEETAHYASACCSSYYYYCSYYYYFYCYPFCYYYYYYYCYYCYYYCCYYYYYNSASAVLAIGSDTLDNGAWVQGRSSKIVVRLATIHC